MTFSPCRFVQERDLPVLATRCGPALFTCFGIHLGVEIFALSLNHVEQCQSTTCLNIAGPLLLILSNASLLSFRLHLSWEFMSKHMKRRPVH